MILSSIIGLYQDQKAGLQRTLMQQTEVLNLGPVSLHQRFHPLTLPFPGNHAVTVDSASLSSAQKTKGTVDQRLSRFSRV